MTNKTSLFWGLTAILVLLGGQAAFGQDMTESQRNALETINVPMYPGSSFITADEDGHMVLWFSSADDPDAIMDWYEEQLPDWSSATIGGTRVVYKGPAGLEQEEIMSFPYVFVSSAERLGRDPGENNEITVRIPGSP